MQTHRAFILFYQCKHQSFEWTTRWKSPNPDGILNKGMPFRETMVPEGAVIVMSQLVRFYTWLSVVISRKIKEYNKQVWEVSGGGGGWGKSACSFILSFLLSFFLGVCTCVPVGVQARGSDISHECWWPELRSSCLRARHFTYWTVSLAIEGVCPCNHSQVQENLDLFWHKVQHLCLR